MNLKKIIAAAMVGALSVTAAPIFVPGAPSAVISRAEAARGGARIAPKAAPSAPKSAPAPSSGNSKSVSGNGNSYAPSKSANQLDKNAPAAGAKAGTAANAGAANMARSHTGWGNALRSIGLLAGGMLLGSMLASMLGLGGGFLADLLGVLANVAMVMIAFMAIRWLFRRLRGRGEENVYQSAAQPHAAAPKAPIQDIRPPGAAAPTIPARMGGAAGDSPRVIADRYRSRQAARRSAASCRSPATCLCRVPCGGGMDARAGCISSRSTGYARIRKIKKETDVHFCTSVFSAQSIKIIAVK